MHAISRDLGVHKKTVQQYRDAFLATGALVVSGGRYAKGPAFAVERGAVNDRAPPRTATAPWVATDGSRTFEVLRAPATHPTAMPGFGGTVLTGRGSPDKKRRDHTLRALHDGRTFHLLLMEQPAPKVGHGWSLQLKKVSPPPRLSEIDGGDQDVEAVWDRYALAAIRTWAQGAGVEISNVVRRSSRVSLALPHVVDPALKFRSQDADADGTPEPGTVEVRTAVLKDFIETGPEALAAIGRQLQRVEEQVSGLSALVAKEATIAERIVGVQSDQARAVAGVLEAIASTTRPPVASAQPSSPGVEYQ